MRIRGKHYHTIWEQGGKVCLIDQTLLPFRFEVLELNSVAEVAHAIRHMQIRGAPAIGIAAAYGMYLAVTDKAQSFQQAAELLKATRPTAINLAWAVDQQLAVAEKTKAEELKQALLLNANALAKADIDACRSIGRHGFELFKKIAEKNSGEPLRVMTHCNAGWLACVDYGTATAPMYEAQARGLDVHVWVSETRPRNQGAQLTAFELLEQGVKHTVIADNAAGILMQKGEVDVVIVGSDRTSVTGDVANKVGTYLKALAAKANGIPFYVALPSSTFDWKLKDGVKEIPIEYRSPDEVTRMAGDAGGERQEILTAPHNSPALNPAFDVTPRALVTGLITERGVCDANEQSIRQLFPEKGL